MSPMEPFQAALKALRANKLRSMLTTLGIIIGVAAVIIVVSLVQGLERSVLKQIERAGSQTLFVRPLMPQDIPFDQFVKDWKAKGRYLIARIPVFKDEVAYRKSIKDTLDHLSETLSH